ncbi:MAG: glycosyltransferase [Candidatus Eremiobacteraeota bacterium]|nr:glycosyltransferase [Candidatus Eremiobacteraeota bacterium]
MLRECLESVAAQTYAPVEIIVVDSFSTDGTAELAAQFGTVYSYGRDPSQKNVFAVPHQRNYGVAQANGEYVYWFDSDMRMRPTTVADCVALIERTHADAVIVPEESYGEGFWAQCRRLEKTCYNRNAVSLTDAARFLRKAVWTAVGGLDATLGGNDDYDFQLRLNDAGYTTVKLGDSIRHYEGRLNLGKHLRKKFIYGKTALRYFRKHASRKALLARQYAVIRPDFIAQGRLLLREPITAAGMVTMKLLEYSAAACGLIYSMLRHEDVQLRTSP